jgi:hypothetical protein
MCLITLIFGLLLLMTAHGMPSHTDERRADELTRLYEGNYTSPPEKLEPIRKEIVALRTSKWDLHDTGLDMCLLSVSLLLTAIHFRLWDLRNLRTMKTPRTRSRLLGLATIALLALLLPALQLQTDYEYIRDDLAPTIDTGRGGTLFFGTELFLLLWIPMLLIGRFVILRRATLPANLWGWNRAQPAHSLILNASFGSLAVILVVLISWSAINFSWAIPSLLVGLYVVLSTRAALMQTIVKT